VRQVEAKSIQAAELSVAGTHTLGRKKSLKEGQVIDINTLDNKFMLDARKSSALLHFAAIGKLSCRILETSRLCYACR
jgi:hypothetical protein